LVFNWTNRRPRPAFDRKVAGSKAARLRLVISSVS
jgi:hypothetical protein